MPKSRSQKRRCDLCEFWVIGEQWRDTERGSCHRYAPRPTLGDYEYELMRHLTYLSWDVASDAERESDFMDWEEAYLGECCWPTTAASSWCGDFVSRGKTRKGPERAADEPIFHRRQKAPR